MKMRGLFDEELLLRLGTDEELLLVLPSVFD